MDFDFLSAYNWSKLFNTPFCKIINIMEIIKSIHSRKPPTT